MLCLPREGQEREQERELKQGLPLTTGRRKQRERKEEEEGRAFL
jgi:hypothetical protein